jgi:hypothetical protein
MLIPILIFKFYLTLINSIIYGFSTVLGLILFSFAVSNSGGNDYLLEEGMPIQEVSKIESTD